MAGWFGELEVLVEPLVGRVIEHLTAQRLLHVDETPVPVLDPGSGKTTTAHHRLPLGLPQRPLECAQRRGL